MKKQNKQRSFCEKIKAMAQHQVVQVIFILLAVIFSFANTFANDFVLDDYEVIKGWPLTHHLSSLPRFFINYIPLDGQGDVYSPGRTFLQALNFTLWGMDSFGYHLFALLVHVAGTFLVYLITWQLVKNRTIAFLTSLFFGIHPVHVESVAFLSASVENAGFVFLLASFYYYIKASSGASRLTVGEDLEIPVQPAKDQKPLKIRRERLAFVFGVLAVFTNEFTLSLPLLFLVYDLLFRGGEESWKQIARRVLPFFVLVGFYMFVKWQVLGVAASGMYLKNSFYLTMLVSVKALAKYVWIAFVPMTLTHNHVISSGIFSFNEKDFYPQSVATQSLGDPQVLLSLAVVVGLIALAAWMYKKKPLIAFGVSWFFICLLPGMNIIPTSVYFRERYLYAGVFGFCLLLGYGMDYLFREKSGPLPRKILRGVSVGLIVVLVCGYSVRTVTRNRDWRDPVTILESAVKINPKSGFLRYELGFVYLKYALKEKSLKSFEEAIKINPQQAQFYFSKERALSALRRYPEAAKSLEKAIEINPEFAEAHYNIAGMMAYFKQNDLVGKYLNDSVRLYKKQNRIFEAGEAVVFLKSFMQIPEQAIQAGLLNAFPQKTSPVE